MQYRFEAFELDSERYELRHEGVPVALEPQVFAVLAYLVEHADRVVRKEDLLAAVWGTTFVSDDALTTRIKQARRALGDNGRDQRLIRTVHRRGYRFTGTLEGALSASRPPVRRGHVRFCETADGVRIAYAVTGQGPPLVKVANWLSHLEYDEQSPVWRHLIDELSRDFTLVRYDARGSGLSDREIDDEGFSLDAWVRDLEAVVDALDLARFPLLGISQGGPIAVAYTARHPERVSHLLLHGSFARGHELRGTAEAEVGRALDALTRHGWGDDRSVYAQMLAARLVPHGSTETLRWLVDLQRVSASKDSAARFRHAFGVIDVDHLLPQVTAPALVLHSRGDQGPPFEEGRRLASRLPDARLVALDSDNHLLLADEPAWPVMIEAIREFLGVPAVRDQRPPD